MQVGSNYVRGPLRDRVHAAQTATQADQTWYQFKVPVTQYDRKVGNIPDFKSIRFMRMFLTGFEDSVVLRFAKLDLVRNQWRRYLYELKPGDPIPVDQTTVVQCFRREHRRELQAPAYPIRAASRHPACRIRSAPTTPTSC